ncbi:MAG TPA: SDR family oxidoreductase [Firmicutes bacterium]|jgi:3-oxoacyl-[acyl-carrier protein] reductase|nr:SDR family oxidoreductase [Bacillota bacterium]
MSVKVALVTGGVAGIGEAIALGLADDGYKVVVCDINQERGQAVEERNPGKLVFRECNVADEESVQALVRGVVEEFGRIDVLVNNAGIIRRRHSEEISVADWDIVFTVNVRGAFLLCKYVAEVMKQQGTGRIVNISSVAAKLGDITSAPGYGPSKAAMDGLTKTFARELAPYGITVNGVAPHAIETDMSAQWSPERRAAIIDAIPLKRLGQPQDVAACVRFLVSEGAGFITGEIIDVNGGFLMD